jgi:hypothetical protein
MQIKYERQWVWGFEYDIDGLTGFATLYTHSNGIDNNVLHKYIDIEHGIQGGGYYDRLDAKKDFKNKIKELAK